MKRTVYRDKLLWIRVRLALYRWHGVPVFAVLSIGKLDPERPPWHVIAAMLAFEAISLGAGVFHWTMVYARW